MHECDCTTNVPYNFCHKNLHQPSQQLMDSSIQLHPTTKPRLHKLQPMVFPTATMDYLQSSTGTTSTSVSLLIHQLSTINTMPTRRSQPCGRYVRMSPCHRDCSPSRISRSRKIPPTPSLALRPVTFLLSVNVYPDATLP